MYEARTVALISITNLLNNFELIKKQAAGAKVMAVIKADAYGHGAVSIAKHLQPLKPDFFAVACIDEAMELRNADINEPLFVLGYTEPSLAPLLCENNITQCAVSLSHAKLLNEALIGQQKKLDVHIKIDTGMSRVGIPYDEDFTQLKSLDMLNITGVFTHFAVADSKKETDIDFTKQQYDKFVVAKEALIKCGFDIKLAHCNNSAATMLRPEMRGDMVRTGIILYGLKPSGDVDIEGFKPLMTLQSTVALVKELASERSISYGRTYTCLQPTKVATITLGYADGYSRLLSSNGVFEVNGKPAKVLGRVCMDQLVVDVTGIDGVKAGDRVTAFGGFVADSIDDIASKTGTINYEIVCDISKRVHRIYTD